MREVDFLPAWYPKVRKRKRVVALQAWITLILICGLGLWMLLVQRNVYARDQELGALRTDLSRSEIDLKRLDDLLEMQRQLGQQDLIFSRIGRPIEMTRVMSTLQHIMPQDMALLNLSLDTEETPKAAAGSFAARAQAKELKRDDRRLRFKLHGVCPTDVDLGEFLAKLTSKPFFKNVELMYTRERVDSGHVMREFEVSFLLDLSAPPPASPTHASHAKGGR